jgi:hypothetical protein
MVRYHHGECLLEPQLRRPQGKQGGTTDPVRPCGVRFAVLVMRPMWVATLQRLAPMRRVTLTARTEWSCRKEESPHVF